MTTEMLSIPWGPKYWGGSVDALKYIATGYDWGCKR